MIRHTCIYLAACAGLLPVVSFAELTSTAGSSAPVATHQQSLGITYAIRTSGLYPSSGGSPVGTLGEIAMFAEGFTPAGYLPADGRQLPINQNQALFSLLGTTYGGNGMTHFALPDLRGRMAVGAGSGPGLTSHTVGEKFGSPSVTLTASNLPAHAHDVPLTPPVTTSITGSAQPYTKLQPSLAINYIVPMGGVYPSRDGGGYVGYEPTLGFIYATANAYLPDGWITASGQTLAISQNTALFSLLGTNYGGNGKTTFMLPDLRGRAPIGVDAGSDLLGQMRGSETLTLTAGHMPSHTHGISSIGQNTLATGSSAPIDNLQPSLGLHYVIATEGIYPMLEGSGSIDEPLIGQISLFAGNFAPGGWAFCDGQILNIAEYEALYSLIGTTYGGDGINTFRLPDLTDTLALGAGVSPGLPGLLPGHTLGSNTLTLTSAQLPAHDHSVAVPEPALAGLLILPAALLARRRRA